MNARRIVANQLGHGKRRAPARGCREFLFFRAECGFPSSGRTRSWCGPRRTGTSSSCKIVSSPRVAIIVRSIGHPHLARAIASLRAQTHANLATILVIANPAFAPEPTLAGAGVEVIPTDIWLPRPLAANRGLDAARAGFIGFLDEDDWLAPDHVTTLVAALDANPGYALAYSDTVIAGEPPAIMSRGYWKQRFQDFPVFTINAALFASSLVASGCRFDPDLDLVEDWDFWLQCAEKTDFLHVGAATANYDPASGTSGTGHADNRDPTKSRQDKAMLGHKWLTRYRAIDAASAQALRVADERIAASAYEAGRDGLLAALRIDPGNPMLLNRLAACLRRVGDPRTALAAMRRACDVDRRASELWVQLALLNHECGDRAEAARVLAYARSLAMDATGEARLAAAAMAMEHS